MLTGLLGQQQSQSYLWLRSPVVNRNRSQTSDEVVSSSKTEAPYFTKKWGFSHINVLVYKLGPHRSVNGSTLSWCHFAVNVQSTLSRSHCAVDVQLNLKLRCLYMRWCLFFNWRGHMMSIPQISLWVRWEHSKWSQTEITLWCPDTSWAIDRGNIKYNWVTTTENVPSDMCAKRRLESACACAQSD